jgi:hypothetical protein
LKFLELEKVNLKLEKNDDTPFFNVSSDQKTKKNIINILNTQLLSILLKSANKIVVLRSFSIEKKREKINFTELTLTNVGSVLKIIARKKDIEIRFNIHYSIANNFVLFKNHSTIEINNIRFNLSFSRNSSDKATFVFLLNISDWVVIKEFLKRIKMENLYLLPIDGGRFGLMIQVDVLIKESKNYVKAFVRPFNQLIYSNHFYLKCPFSHLVTSENIGSKSITISKEYTNHLSINLISINFIKALIQSEDPNFHRHKGIDLIALSTSLATNLNQHSIRRGGSTITMQTFKNLFYNKDDNRSIFRKIEEIFIASYIEEKRVFSKIEIVEIYINIIKFGKNLVGLKDASYFYFNKSPIELSLYDSLILTYIIPRPNYVLEAITQASPQFLKNIENHILRHAHAMFKKCIISDKELKSILRLLENGFNLQIFTLTESPNEYL